ncbi:MAG: cytochrome c [Phycisphaerales bacterium]|nr:cytochrome c [Phycisphaerales bacterium]
MSKLGCGILIVVVLVALLPFALVARSRAIRSKKGAVHPVLDMDQQARKNAQSPSPMFADGRAMRPQIDGVLAREDITLQPETLNDPINPRVIGKPLSLTDPTTHANIMLGRVRPAAMTDDQFNAIKPPTDDAAIAKDTTFYVKTIPLQIPVTPEFIRRGQDRFDIYCFPCHGQSGYGDGPVAIRAKSLQDAPPTNDPTAASAWVQPQNLNEPKILTRTDGHLFNTITHGIRTMPPYDKQISILDRWSIISYVRALQKSQNADISPATRPRSH